MDIFKRLTTVEYGMKKCKYKIFKSISRQLYHVGSTLKNLVKKCFEINRIDLNKVIEKLM